MSYPTADETRAAFRALRNDLIHADGPRISTMRNYRFAILLYDPANEFLVRREAAELEHELRSCGWLVRPISLQKLLVARARACGPAWIERVIEMERRMAAAAPERGIGYLQSKLGPLIEGKDGLAADCGRMIDDALRERPDAVDRTLALIGRSGAVYPFFRSSALLRQLDGRTHNVPVVLLYPGKRQGPTSLSFMGMLQPDADYRPRIYA
jgi:hypothetical protein